MSETASAIRPDRVGKIGASQVAAILDLNPFESQRSIQEDIRTGRWETTPREPGLPARLGHIFEPGMLVALEDYLIHEDGLGTPDAKVYPWEPACLACGRPGVEEEVGKLCGKPSKKRRGTLCTGIVSDTIIASGDEWAVATPDGKVDFGARHALAECKAPFRGRIGAGLFQWGDPTEIRSPMSVSHLSVREIIIERLRQWPIPIYYAAQTQWQMGVARTNGLAYDFNFLCAMGLPYRPVSVYTIEFDAYLFDMMLDMVRAWHARFILGDEPAPIRTKDEALAMFPREKPGVKRVLSQDEYDLFCEWQRRKLMVSMLTHAKGAAGSVAELDARVIQCIGDADQVCDPDGNYIGRFPAQATGGRIDGAALKKAHPDIYDQFYRPGNGTRVWRPSDDWKNSIAAELASVGLVDSGE